MASEAWESYDNALVRGLAFLEDHGKWLLRAEGHGSPELTSATLTGLVEAAKAGSNGALLAIERDTAVTIAGGAQELAEVVGSLEPNGSLDEHLSERYEELREDELFCEIGPIDTGISINGAAWGWIPTATQNVAFALVPIVDNPRKDVVSFSAWQSESMTGAVETWEVSLHGDVAVLCHEADTSEPESTYQAPQYVLPDPDEMLALVTRDWINDGSFYDDGPPCPVCDQEGGNGMGGWVLTLRTDGSFSDEQIGRALAKLWEPCPDHPAPLVTFGGETWRWVGDRWALTPASDTGS